MNLTEYEHMKKVYNYVFSVPPGAERDKRLSEIGEEDSNKLWDFYSGLCSGRIKKPEVTNKEREVCVMNDKKTIASYEDFKAALKRTSYYKTLCEFKRNNPETYKRYLEKMEAERSR